MIQHAIPHLVQNNKNIVVVLGILNCRWALFGMVTKTLLLRRFECNPSKLSPDFTAVLTTRDRSSLCLPFPDVFGHFLRAEKGNS